MFSTNINFSNVEKTSDFLRRGGSVVSVIDGIVTIKGLDYAKYVKWLVSL